MVTRFVKKLCLQNLIYYHTVIIKVSCCSMWYISVYFINSVQWFFCQSTCHLLSSKSVHWSINKVMTQLFNEVLKSAQCMETVVGLALIVNFFCWEYKGLILFYILNVVTFQTFLRICMVYGLLQTVFCLICKSVWYTFQKCFQSRIANRFGQWPICTNKTRPGEQGRELPTTIFFCCIGSWFEDLCKTFLRDLNVQEVRK